MCATTGIAAINMGGEATTVNALLRYYDTASLEEAYTAGFLQATLRKHRRAGLRRILLDEVSMLDGHQLTLLVRALDEVNAVGDGWATSIEDEYEAEETAIGLTLVGDFCQLPPVKAPFAFESPEWGRFAAHTLKLTTMHRQTDPTFATALRWVRGGYAKAALEILRDCLADRLQPNFDGPTLLAKNDAVDRYNGLRLDGLKGGVVLSKASRWGTQRPDWKQVPEVLTLKPGALVMVLANCYDHDEGRYLYVNGDLGVFEGVNDDGTACVTLQRGGVQERVTRITRDNLQPLEVGERKKLKVAGLTDRIKGKSKVVGAVSYLPLRLAWASTVHKSQGLSLDQVQVNLREPFMAQPGMVYVALSRAREKAGLRIVGSPETFLARCVADKRLVEWL